MNGRIRIVHLVSSTQRRGAEMFAQRLVRRLNAGPYENVVCALVGNNVEIDRVPVRAVRRTAVIGRKLPIDPRAAWDIRGTVRKTCAHILVAHGADTLKYAASARALGSRATTIYLNIGVASHWAKGSFKVALNRRFLARVDAVVSVSEATREDFQHHYGYPTDKTYYISNGVEIDDYAQERLTGSRMVLRREIGLPDRAIAIVSVGSLTPEKNHDLLLSALTDLDDDVHLVLAGDGHLRAMLEQRAQALGVASRTHFLGSRSDIPEVLGACDMFVLASKTEGMPAALIEAGLAGLPGVAFRVGGIAEVIDENRTGFMVEPGEDRGFARAMAHLANDPALRSRMGNTARQRYADRFGMDAITGQWEALFDRLLATRSAIGDPDLPLVMPFTDEKRSNDAS